MFRQSFTGSALLEMIKTSISNTGLSPYIVTLSNVFFYTRKDFMG